MIVTLSSLCTCVGSPSQMILRAKDTDVKKPLRDQDIVYVVVTVVVVFPCEIFSLVSSLASTIF